MPLLLYEAILEDILPLKEYIVQMALSFECPSECACGMRCLNHVKNTFVVGLVYLWCFFNTLFANCRQGVIDEKKTWCIFENTTATSWTNWSRQIGLLVLTLYPTSRMIPNMACNLVTIRLYTLQICDAIKRNESYVGHY